MRALGLLAVLVGATGCVRQVPLPSSAEVQRARTSDGWDLEVVRYRPKGAPTGRPVILCHGISANARNMDLDDEHSMARFMASQGREAWTMSLRATGTSDGPDAAKGRSTPVTFDDFWRKDLPAVIAHVRAATGSDEVDYVGHSMGGMVLYAYLSQGGTGIHAAATMGSPTRLDWGQGFEGPVLAAAPLLSVPSLFLPTALGAHALVPFEGTAWDGPGERLFYQPSSSRPEVWQRLIAYGTADISGGVIAQLRGLLENGSFRSSDGRLDFKADMRAIHTPILVVAGKLDRLALAPAVKDGYRALGGPKAWLLITRANGARGEYGHMDLVFGENAAAEVWRPVLDFLNRHAVPGP